MSSTRNGPDQTYRDKARRLRVDDMAAIVARNSPGPSQSAATGRQPGTHSGRRFVLVAGLVVLAIWGTLNLVFREWKARYQRRAQYGATQVVPVIDPLSGVMPPGVDVARWRDAVEQTRSMLLTVTGSNLLDVADMVELKVELTPHVRTGCRTPARAPDELAEIWNIVADRGEFLFRDSRSLSGDRHPRPRVLPTYGATRVAPALQPLNVIVPAGHDPIAWRAALDQTRALLVSVTDSGRLTVIEMQKLRAAIDKHVGRTSEHPETALVELAAIWDELADRRKSVLGDGQSPRPGQHPRPAILPPR